VSESNLGDKVWTTKFKKNPEDGKLGFQAIHPSDYSSKLCFCEGDLINSGTQV